jgi:hypothetical protein
MKIRVRRVVAALLVAGALFAAPMAVATPAAAEGTLAHPPTCC